MSTANKLTYLNGTKQAIKQAINEDFEVIDNNTTFREYADEISSNNAKYKDLIPKETKNATNTLDISNSAGLDKALVTLYGNTYQEGEPTPDAPVDVSVVSGDNEIKVEGKNLFNDYYSGADAVLRGVTKKAGDNCVILNGTYDKIYNLDLWLTDSNQSTTGNMVLLKANTQYSVSIILEGTYSFNFTTAWISSRTLDNTFSWNYKTLEYSNGEFKGTFTTGNTDIYIGGIRLPISTTCDATFTNTKVKIQVEEGQPTDYQEYKGTTYQITLPEGTELCKIGDYKDRIYPLNGKWYLEKKIDKIVLNGNENINLDTTKTITQVFNISNVLSRGVKDNLGICNYFINQAGDTEKFSYLIGDIVYRTLYIAINKTKASTVQEFKTWLSTHNTELYYPLATPTTTEITESNYPTLYNQLNNIKLFEGVNHITMTNESGLDVEFDITYYKDWKLD